MRLTAARRHSARLQALIVLLCGLPSAASAQNYRETPIGGRTATMGGAATAAGNDSAMPYLNPAGLAGVPGDIFAISAAVYGYTHRSYQNYFFPSGTPPLLGYRVRQEAFSTSSLAELPSSVMYIRHLSEPDADVQERLGVSLVIPSARRIELVASVAGALEDVAGESLETASVTADSRRYYLGPSYAIGWDEKLRFGASVYAVYARSSHATTSASSISVLGGSVTSASNGQNAQLADACGATAVVGAQLQVLPKLWLGVGLAAPSLPLGGRLRFTSESGSVTPDPTTGHSQPRSTTTTLDGSYLTREPLRFNAGVAYDDRERYSIAADVHYYASGVRSKSDGVQLFEDRRGGELTRRYAIRQRTATAMNAVLDFSVGAEVVLRPKVALRAGAFTDLSSMPPLSRRTEDVHRLRLQRYGGSLGLGLTFGSFDSTTGVVIVRGTGEYGAPDTWITGDVVPIRATETSALLVLSGAVTVAEAKRTIAETVPFTLPPFPDFDDAAAAPRAPRIPAPLPPEPAPAPPPLRWAPPPPLPPPPSDATNVGDQDSAPDGPEGAR